MTQYIITQVEESSLGGVREFKLSAESFEQALAWGEYMFGPVPLDIKTLSDPG